jgi:hypothetical protein
MTTICPGTPKLRPPEKQDEDHDDSDYYVGIHIRCPSQEGYSPPDWSNWKSEGQGRNAGPECGEVSLKAPPRVIQAAFPTRPAASPELRLG